MQHLMKRCTLIVLALVLSVAGWGLNAEPQVAPARSGVWVGTWAASASPPGDSPFFKTPSFQNVTLRQIVHTSVGGEQVRVRISNTYGAKNFKLGAAHIAVQTEGASIDPGTDRALTFSGLSEIDIPAGATVVSDPVSLSVRPFSNLAISTFFPESTGLATNHATAIQTSYISGSGNHVSDKTLTMPQEVQSWFFVDGVEVLAAPGTKVVVAFGDSITDGMGGTPNANRRWPNLLARRLADRKSGPPVAVLDQGISGNRLLHDVAGQNALARFDRDVLAWLGVTHLIILEGINDIGFSEIKGAPFGDAVDTSPVSADAIIAAHKQLIARARARGIKVLGATLLPYIGAAYASPAGEAKRQAVNKWIREGGVYDGVIDFDRAVSDPKDPSKIRADLHSGDWLHPNDAGYAAMAAAIDLKLLE